MLKSEGFEERFQIVELHAKVQQEQQAIIAHSQRQLLILATNVAETSLTLPDVGIVIDSGLQRQMAVNALTGQNELVLGYISVQNAVQRRGRTGRSCDGLYVPVFSQGDLKPRQEYEFQKMCPWAELLLILDKAGPGEGAHAQF